MSDDKPIDRRRFFRAGLAELFKPLAKAARPLEQLAHEIGKLEDPLPTPRIKKPHNTVSYGTWPAEPEVTNDDPQAPVWLRPPGARPEEDFLNVCSRCGECTRVCPVQCIKIDASGAHGKGAPYIDADVAACTMCDGLFCMHNCPSSALQFVPREEIDMGLAHWQPHTCLRGHGEMCTMCVDHCPVGETAIEVHGSAVHVKTEGCTGCGSCQQYCPTNPKSIIVKPRDGTSQVARENHG